MNSWQHCREKAEYKVTIVKCEILTAQARLYQERLTMTGAGIVDKGCSHCKVKEKRRCIQSNVK